MDAITISPVEPTSLMLRDWHDVMRDAYLEGHEAMWWESFGHLQQSVTNPHSRNKRFLFAAIGAGCCVGALELTIAVERPSEPVQIELGVAVDNQGAGVGRELASYAVAFARQQGCTTLQTEIFVPGLQSLESRRSGQFAARQGFTVGNVEDRFLLDLPWDHRGASSLPVDAVRTQSWVGECPTEHEQGWAALEQQMEEDRPLGDLTRGDTMVDVARMRETEHRMLERGWLVIRTMALLDGKPAGYTELLVDRDHPELVVQDSTLVDRAARGRGIGRALKTANLQQLGGLPDDIVQQMRHAQTYTAQGNTPMQQLNAQFGFRKVSTMHDAELRL